jgi:hypothetical protein
MHRRDLGVLISQQGQYILGKLRGVLAFDSHSWLGLSLWNILEIRGKMIPGWDLFFGFTPLSMER